jgi:hypothetical protein
MSNQTDWLARTIEVYSAEDEALVDEHALPPVDLALLQQNWQRPEDDPMLDMFEIAANRRAVIEVLAGLKLDLLKHSYFLAAHTTNDHGVRNQGGFMGGFAPPRDLSPSRQAGLHDGNV